MKNLEFYEDLNVDDILSFQFDGKKAILKISSLRIGSVTGAGMIRGDGVLDGEPYHFHRVYISTKEKKGSDTRVTEMCFASEEDIAELEKLAA